MTARSSSTSSRSIRSRCNRKVEYENKTCYCGLSSPPVSSGTWKNYSRIFYGCPKYPSRDMCKYFEWADPDVCPYGVRAMRKFKAERDNQDEEIFDVVGVNRGLNEEIDVLTKEIQSLKEETAEAHGREKLLQRMIISIVVVFGLLLWITR